MKPTPQLIVLIVAHCIDLCNKLSLGRDAYQRRLDEELIKRGVDPVPLELLESLS